MEQQIPINILRQLGVRHRQYRKQMMLTVDQVADQSGVDAVSIEAFEDGTANNLSLLAFIKLLQEMDGLASFDQVLPELPESPRQLFLKQQQMNFSNYELL